MRQTAAKPDALVAGRPVPLAWVLLQTVPKLEVLGVSEDKRRVAQEMADLSEMVSAAKMGERRFLVLPTNILFA